MPILLHAIIAASYFLLATALALLLPQSVPWMTVETAPFAGGIVFLAGALLHVVFAQAERHRRTMSELSLVRRQAREIAGDLLDTQTQALQLRQTMEQAGRAGEQRVSEVVSEVKVLQGLIEAFSRQHMKAGAMGAAGSASGGGRPHLVAMQGGKGGHAHAFADGFAEPEVVEIVREALREDRVDVYLQPIVSLPQRKTRFYECFSRIRGADGTVVTPDQYIEPARRGGLLTAVDNMLLFRCVQLVRKAHRAESKASFFCALSAHTLSDRAFFRDFIAFMENHRELTGSLVLEMTQADFDHEREALAADLGRLGAMGFRLALSRVRDLDLDLDALATLNIQFVKIDAGLVLETLAAEGEAAMRLRELKQRLDRREIDLIVDGIETERMLVELLEFSIDFGQGYLFGEPKPAATAGDGIARDARPG